MEQMIDSSLWVDYFRPKTPLAIKRQVAAVIDDAESVLCEPIRFEIMRAANNQERLRIEQTFATLPMLPSPVALWDGATKLGQRCTDVGCLPPAIDLLIAAVCIAHQVKLVTFDADFLKIAKVSSLQLELLARRRPPVD
jgi:predicted nucleic acid-binding protein